MLECCRVGHATEDNIIPHMRFAYWMMKDIDTHLEYVILIAVLRQQCLGESVRFTLYVLYMACPIELHDFRSSSWSSYTERWRRILTSPTLELQSFASFCILGIGFKVFVVLEQIYLCALINISAVTSNTGRSTPKCRHIASPPKLR